MKYQKPKQSTIIDEPRKLVIPDESGRGNHIVMVINWNDKIKDCEYLKLVMPDRSECIVHKEKFRSILFLIANQEQREKMGRMRITTVRTIKQNYEFQANKDFNIRAGEKFTVPIEIQVPVAIQDEFLDPNVGREGFKRM